MLSTLKMWPGKFTVELKKTYEIITGIITRHNCCSSLPAMYVRWIKGLKEVGMQRQEIIEDLRT